MLELLDYAQGMEVVIEATAMRAHELVELVFSGMAKWRVADVMNEGQSFGERGVQAERSGNGARYLRYFDGVRKAVTKMIGETHGENLRLGLQPAESACMDDAVAVTDIFAAVRMRQFRIAATT